MPRKDESSVFELLLQIFIVEFIDSHTKKPIYFCEHLHPLTFIEVNTYVKVTSSKSICGSESKERERVLFKVFNLVADRSEELAIVFEGASCFVI
jgi:hypothetical protein